MKTIAILSVFMLLLTTGSLSAQPNTDHDHKSKTREVTSNGNLEPDYSMLDRIQMETESISVIKPFLFIASIIDSRLELHRLEKESVAAAKSRESGSH